MLNVPVVSVDETTEVGVIELKTCIQAIVAARWVDSLAYWLQETVLTTAVLSSWPN